jgi:hypothetical protein
MKGIILGLVILSVVATMAMGSASAQPIDVHQINAQIYSNLTVPGVAPGFLTNEHTSGVLPQYDYVVVRSPGNSTLSISINGTYIYHNFVFANETDVPLTLKVNNDTPIIIAIHSDQMNYTRIFHYTAEVLTVQQYISYVESLSPKPPIATFTAGNIILGGLYALGGVVSSILVSVYVIFTKRSNPNVEKGIRGGN